MQLKEFGEIINEAVRDLPEKFKNVLEENQIQLIPRDRVPRPLSEQHKDSIVFGVFIGVPYGRFVNVQTEPTRIELYKSSFELFFNDKDKISRQIRTTVVHEIAHYFGFSESEIRKLGY
jgi:predicted Zn-dependent protease with MMP-like domain